MDEFLCESVLPNKKLINNFSWFCSHLFHVFHSHFSLKLIFVGVPKAADVNGRIVPLQSIAEKTHIVIHHIHFQLFVLGSNGEIPFV